VTLIGRGFDDMDWQQLFAAFVRSFGMDQQGVLREMFES